MAVPVPVAQTQTLSLTVSARFCRFFGNTFLFCDSARRATCALRFCLYCFLKLSPACLLGQCFPLFVWWLCDNWLNFFMGGTFSGATTTAPTGPPGAFIKRASFPEGASAEESSGCEAAEGVLSKQARRGGWQPRYFRLNNNFLLYWPGRKPEGPPVASINLALVRQLLR